MADARGGARYDVLGIGAASVDRVLVLPGVPAPSGPCSKLPILDDHERYGGQVATAMAACARLGLGACFVGTIGGDPPGRRLVQALEAAGVDAGSVVVRPGPSPFAVILIDRATGERIVLWRREASADLTPSMVPGDLIPNARLLHVDDVNAEASIAAAGIARSLGIPATSDLDHADRWTERLVAAVSHPILSQEALAAFTNEGDPELGLRRLRRQHAGLLTVTLGAGGALALDGDRLIRVPAYPVAVVDSTGAGDVFRGGFIYGLFHGWAPAALLRFASAAAAASCTHPGAMASVPSLAEIDLLLGAERSLS